MILLDTLVYTKKNILFVLSIDLLDIIRKQKNLQKSSRKASKSFKKRKKEKLIIIVVLKRS